MPIWEAGHISDPLSRGANFDTPEDAGCDALSAIHGSQFQLVNLACAGRLAGALNQIGEQLRNLPLTRLIE